MKTMHFEIGGSYKSLVERINSAQFPYISNLYISLFDAKKAIEVISSNDAWGGRGSIRHGGITYVGYVAAGLDFFRFPKAGYDDFMAGNRGIAIFDYSKAFNIPGSSVIVFKTTPLDALLGIIVPYSDPSEKKPFILERAR